MCRLFQRFGQTTPHRALQRRRMVYAVDLLQRGDLLVKEVAERMGFDDPFHFSRAFKRECRTKMDFELLQRAAW